jgi:hypothetical protein
MQIMVEDYMFRRKHVRALWGGVKCAAGEGPEGWLEGESVKCSRFGENGPQLVPNSPLSVSDTGFELPVPSRSRVHS